MTQRDADGSEHDDQPPAAEIKQWIQDLEYQGDVETVKELREEGRQTLNQQLDALDDIDEKAMSLLKVNVLIIGVVLSVLTFAADFQDGFTLGAFENLYVMIGIVFLLFSSVFAAITYTSSDTEGGFRAAAIHQAIDADLTKEEFYIGAASSYAKWIDFNYKTNVRNAPLITLTALLMIGGILALSLGVFDAIIGWHTFYLASVSTLVYLIACYYSGIIDQVRQALRVSSPLPNFITRWR